MIRLIRHIYIYVHIRHQIFEICETKTPRKIWCFADLCPKCMRIMRTYKAFQNNAAFTTPFGIWDTWCPDSPDLKDKSPIRWLSILSSYRMYSRIRSQIAGKYGENCATCQRNHSVTGISRSLKYWCHVETLSYAYFTIHSTKHWNVFLAGPTQATNNARQIGTKRRTCSPTRLSDIPKEYGSTWTQAFCMFLQCPCIFGIRGEAQWWVVHPMSF